MINFWYKKIVASFPVSFFIFNDQMGALTIILFTLIIIDTFLGTYVGIKVKQCESHKMRKFTEKVMLYSLTLFSFWLVSNINVYEFKFFFIYNTITIYLSLTELNSIIEKLAFLGMRLPMKFISLINEKFSISQIKNKEDLKKYLNNLDKK